MKRKLFYGKVAWNIFLFFLMQEAIVNITRKVSVYIVAYRGKGEKNKTC